METSGKIWIVSLLPVVLGGFLFAINPPASASSGPIGSAPSVFIIILDPTIPVFMQSFGL